jgi:hypothetical protein
MKSLTRLGAMPVSLPLAADDVVEFHAARLILLVHVCGVSGRIDGLTKMAKLDFFSRYPDFFDAVQTPHKSNNVGAVESSMIRYHYGPWDKRYYHVLAFLEATGLIRVTKNKKAYVMSLTNMGKEKAIALAALPSFKQTVSKMKEIKAAFGSRSGSSLKKMIYSFFDAEVGQLRHGEVIKL